MLFVLHKNRPKMWWHPFSGKKYYNPLRPLVSLGYSVPHKPLSVSLLLASGLSRTVWQRHPPWHVCALLSSLVCTVQGVSWSLLDSIPAPLGNKQGKIHSISLYCPWQHKDSFSKVELTSLDQ